MMNENLATKCYMKHETYDSCFGLKQHKIFHYSKTVKHKCSTTYVAVLLLHSFLTIFAS